MNIGMPVRNALVTNKIYPPQFSDRYNILTKVGNEQTSALSLLVPAFSGMDFYVNPLITE